MWRAWDPTPGTTLTRPERTGSAHRDWRAWTIAMVLLALMLLYVMTDSLALSRATRTVDRCPK